MEEATIKWSSFLSTCRKTSDVEMAERVVKCLMKLDLDETCAYVHISNACYSWVFPRGSWTEGFHERNASKEVSPVQFGDVDYKVHGLDFFCRKRH